MSELNNNGFFEIIKKEKQDKLNKKIILESKAEEDLFWENYAKNLTILDIVEVEENNLNKNHEI